MNPNTIIKETDDFRTIAFKGDFIFEPADGKINILRKHDFQQISEFGCNVVNVNSALHCNQAGIIVINSDGAYIVNKT